MSDESKNYPAPSRDEPTATHPPVPIFIIVLTLVLLFGGFIYFDQTSGWFDPQVYGPYKSSEQLEAFQPQSGAGAVMAQGKNLYERNCGICHGTDGAGKPGQAPPLAGSEWVNAKGVNRLAMIPLEGLNGPIQVKGQPMVFPNGMVAVGAMLSDADLAAVLTYIRGSWGNKAEPVGSDDVNKIRAKIGGHSAPLNGEQLQKLPE